MGWVLAIFPFPSCFLDATEMSVASETVAAGCKATQSTVLLCQKFAAILLRSFCTLSGYGLYSWLPPYRATQLLGLVLQGSNLAVWHAGPIKDRLLCILEVNVGTPTSHPCSLVHSTCLWGHH